MKLCIIANPIAGRGHGYRALQCFMRKWPYDDWECELLETRQHRSAGELAREQLSHPPDLLAVCGGDGTLKEVATMVPSPPFPVALLPAGTANVLARVLGLPLDPLKALAIALRRSVRRVDLGTVIIRAEHSFLLMVGIGFDAYVASRVRPAMKNRLGMLAYAVSSLGALTKYTFPEFQVVTGQQELNTTWCLVANARRYGGGLALTPDADMTDGLFDVLVIEGRSRLAYLSILLSALLGIPPRHHSLRRFRASNLNVKGPSGLYIQADGELVGDLPCEIHIAPKGFPLVVPDNQNPSGRITP